MTAVQTIPELLAAARKSLVETGTRNRLIHVRRDARRANALNIINERSDDIFRLLGGGTRKMRFLAKGQEEGGEDGAEEGADGAADDGVTLGEMADTGVDERRYTDSFLETPLTPDALQKRLLRMAREARTAEEEMGVNVLFLAMGFLRWYESPSSEVLRESPLVLLPVELVRNERTSTYDIRHRDDDIAVNQPLQERLANDFGVALPGIDDAEEWTPGGYFAKVEDAVSGKARWSVDHDGMQLGFFSFAKLTMLHDLEPDNWADDALAESPLVGGLLRDGFAREPRLYGDDANLDEHLAPADIVQVVDADYSQTKVIQEVRAGRNLVVQGPPGTGKSQTITNILAAAAHDGKKVLFVAEKMAALDVVYKRMCRAGLRDLCLELHSRQANKKAFLAEIAATIANADAAGPTAGLDASGLREARDQLNRLARLLHAPLPGRDHSPFQVLSELVGLLDAGAPPPSLDAAALEGISRAEEDAIYALMDRCGAIAAEQGSEEDNPYRSATRLDLEPPDVLRLLGMLGEAADGIDAWLAYMGGLDPRLTGESADTLAGAGRARGILAHLTHMPPHLGEYLELAYENRGSARFREALELANDWVGARAALADAVSDTIWNQDLGRLRPAISRGAHSWLARVFGGYRGACAELAGHLKGELPGAPQERLALLDAVLAAQAKKRAFEDEEPFLKARLGEAWRGARTPFADIAAVAAWLAGTDGADDAGGSANADAHGGVGSAMGGDGAHDGVVEAAGSDGGAGGALADLPLEDLKALVADEDLRDFDLSAFDAQRVSVASQIQAVVRMLGLGEAALARAPLPDVRARFQAMRAHSGLYEVWARLERTRAQLSQRLAPGGPVLEAVARTQADGWEAAKTELRYALADARWRRAREANAELANLSNLDRHQLVSDFQALERRRVGQMQAYIRARHLGQVPLGAGGEIGFLRGEIGKKSRHRPIRTVMRQAGTMVQRLKPVFLMSPISVAQFLPPGALEFDLLVIDEASQVRPEDALGSIARARQVVVVGDQKQLPPTSFFQRMADGAEADEEEDEGVAALGAQATEMESVLSLCEARGLNQGMLEWHYRSRDPSLIAVSNDEFYGRRLILPPCPTQEDPGSGLRLHRVPGVYSTPTRGGGRPRTNRIEAEAVAGRLREWAERRPDFSVGIVTFSAAQADMVTEVLEYRRRQDGLLDSFLREGRAEDVFVKNIENVQGDERDVILISVGYGPHEAGGRLASMNFGPVNADGGERRLNVLFTRSRIACEVFASFDPGDIDPGRTKSDGPRVLRKYLEFAQTGELSAAGEAYEVGGEPDSGFEAAVAGAVRGLGYPADHQVGSAGFRIDLGVRNPRNPSHYILAVECDGATYHGALSARERDRHRQEVLEGFGWRFHRIWSTDWFYRRRHEVRRLKEALEEARGHDPLAALQGANDAPPDAGEDEGEEGEAGGVVAVELPQPQEIEVPLYRRAQITDSSHYEPHEQPLHLVAPLVRAVVDVEGPVHIDEIARRFAEAHGKSSVGRRIREAAVRGLEKAQKQSRGDAPGERVRWLERRGDFWGTAAQFADPPVRDRGQEESPTTKPEYIAAEEIQACAALVEAESGQLELDELARETAKVFGFRRAGARFKARVAAALDRS